MKIGIGTNKDMLERRGVERVYEKELDAMHHIRKDTEIIAEEVTPLLKSLAETRGVKVTKASDLPDGMTAKQQANVFRMLEDGADAGKVAKYLGLDVATVKKILGDR